MLCRRARDGAKRAREGPLRWVAWPPTKWRAFERSCLTGPPCWYRQGKERERKGGRYGFGCWPFEFRSHFGGLSFISAPATLDPFQDDFPWFKDPALRSDDSYSALALASSPKKSIVERNGCRRDPPGAHAGVARPARPSPHPALARLTLVPARPSPDCRRSV